MAREKIPIIYWWKIESEDLNIYVASSNQGAVGAHISLMNGPDGFKEFKKRFSQGRIIKDELLNRPLIKAIKTVLKGKKVTADISLDIQCTLFQRIVWEVITRIPAGQTRTYGEVAAMIGRPGGARAVGQALNRNPLPLIFP